MTASYAIAIALTGALLFAPSFVVLAATEVARKVLRARRFLGESSDADRPKIDVVRPLAGREDANVAAHMSLFAQDVSPARVLFVAEDDDDVAFSAARAAAVGTSIPVDFVVARGAPAVSGKIRNVMTAWAITQNPFVALADADVILNPSMLGRCLSHFDSPDVGAVYMPVLFDATTLPGRLATMTAASDGLAITVASAAFSRSPLLLGGFVVLRRSAVEAAGGLEAIASSIADDVALHCILTKAGFRVRAAPSVLVHRTQGEGWQAWTRRYRRWMLGQWLEKPWHFALGVLGNPFVGAAFASAWLRPRDVASLLVATLVARAVLTRHAARTLARPSGVDVGIWWMVRPLADFYHVAHALDAVVRPIIRWRDVVYLAGLDRRVRRSTRRSRAIRLAKNA